jgi:hypothetical protein
MKLSQFKPTYLYIKRHAITGKCYFGKTTRKDPVGYMGSGKWWKNHIHKHGIEHVETLWFKLFIEQEECTRIALLFSEQQDIVKSNLWLNQIPETGLGGGATRWGQYPTQETRAKLSVASKKVKRTPEWLARLSLARTGIKEKPQQIISCPKCHKSGGAGNMKRYHFENCKVKYEA